MAATQVGLWTVKAGLRGHDAGASGVDEGAESASLPLLKRGWMASSEFVAFSDFCGKWIDLGRGETKVHDRTALSDIKHQRLVSHIVSHCDGTAKSRKTQTSESRRTRISQLLDEMLKRPPWRGHRASGRNDSVVLFSLAKSFTCPQKSLKMGQSDNDNRPRFDNGSDAVSTPSSTPEAPASWPPRHPSTALGPTCVADPVLSFPAPSPSYPSETVS